MTSSRSKRSVLGAIITLSCTWVFSYAGSLPPHPRKSNLMEKPHITIFKLDADEDANLFPGRTAFFKCSDEETLTSTTHWFKDGSAIGVSRKLSKNDLKTGLLRDTIASIIGGRSRRIHSPSYSQLSAINTTDEFTVFTTGILILNNVSKSHAGEYSCILKNTWGNILRRKFVVTVVDKPGCSLQPKLKQHFLTHSNARLHCAANFKKEVSFHWKKDGEFLRANGSSKKFNTLENGALHIFDLNAEDSGEYTCHIETPIGSSSCGPVELNVLVEEINPNELGLLYHTKNITVRPPDDIAELECLADTVNAIYGWIRHGPKLICDSTFCPDNRKGQSPWNNNLILKKVTTEDTGFYNCIINNSHDPTSKTAATTYLNVLSKPEIYMEYRSKIVLLARRIAITCSVEKSNPPSKVYWLKDGVRIDTIKGKGFIEKRIGNTAYLEIMTAESFHRGFYQCISVNSVGAASSATFLGIPKTRPPPTPENFTAVAVSSTKVVADWTYSNTSLIHSFTIAAEDDMGERKIHPIDNTYQHYVFTLDPYSNYTIKLTAFAKHSPSLTASIRVQTPEGKPCGTVAHNTINAISFNTTTILLSWDSLPFKERCGIITEYQVTCLLPGGNMEPRIYYIDNSQAPDDKGIITQYKLFTNLNPGTEYVFSVVPGTRQGFGSDSGFIDTFTVKEPFRRCMSNDTSVFLWVEGHVEDDGRVDVSWAMRQNVSDRRIDVYLVGWDGRAKMTKKMSNKYTNAIFENPVYQSIYIVRMDVYSVHWDVCETYNFTVTRREKQLPKKRILPANLFGLSLGPHCIALGWEYNSTSVCTFVIRYKIWFSPHFTYLNTSENNVTICGLKPGSDYEYGVAVQSSSDTKYHELKYAVSDSYTKTGKIEHDMPGKLNCSSKGGGVVLCGWSPSAFENGHIINYTLQYGKHDRHNVFNNITTNGTQYLLTCLKPGVKYFFKVLASNDAGKSVSSSLVHLVIPSYDGTTSNCSLPSKGELNSETPSEEMDDVTFALIIAGIVVAIGLLLGTALICICFPDFFRWRLCRKKCLKMVRYDSRHNDSISMPNDQSKAFCKQNGQGHVELLTEQNTLLLSSNGFHQNGNVLKGKNHCIVKKNSISKISVSDEPSKQELRSENGISSSRRLFKSKSHKQKKVTAPKEDAVVAEQMQHLILSVPIPKHCSNSSDSRSSSSAHCSMSIDSV